MYHQSVARHRSRRLVAGLLSCHGSFPTTLMLRLAVCIRGNFKVMELQLYKLILLPTIIATWLAGQRCRVSH